MKGHLPSIAFYACLLSSSACAVDAGTSLRTCLEHEGEVDPFAPSWSGTVVDDEGFARQAGVCLRDEVENKVTLQTDEGRLRFSWSHDDAPAAPLLAGNVELTEVATAFNGDTSLAMSDDDGLVAVFASVGSFAPTAGGIVVEHDAVRGVGMSACGSYDVTALRVTTSSGSDVLVEIGESRAIRVDDVPFTFHAFASARSTEWQCTDGGPNQSWAAFREP